MLSRAAESAYWMSRYLERADNVARFIEVNLHLLLDLSIESGAQWRPLVVTTGSEADFRARHGDDASQETVLRYLILEPSNPNSIFSCIRAARENARSIRETIVSEMWELLNLTYQRVRAASTGDEAIDTPYAFLTSIKEAAHLFVGLTESTMSHNEAWHRTRLGRMVERADQTSRIVDMKYYFVLPTLEYVGMPYDNLHWAALLRSATAFEMYRKRHRRIAPNSVAEFLLLDREFPRSMRHCLIRAEESLHAIAGSPVGGFGNPAEQRVGRLRSELDFVRIEEIVAAGLHEYLDRFQSRLHEVGDAIHTTFFATPTSPDSRVAGVTHA